MSEWHPILAAVETSPAVWELRAPDGKPYGRVELRRTVDGPRYRCEHRGELLGWATTLRLGCERVHQAYVRGHGPAGGAVAAWPGM
ncbi:hypothetical protein RR49_01144 [Microbacterium ginsengisoli]|uniref:Uncharacterized protein n=1 Tax=Microbacterium ginsengisoli TaxID=400772 RepID=A0A0F0LUR3_9MICO|nr:hypothetical protein [Microbacterium ginsengisoli]KJL37032.1 hypothetical protein RR49_01144 [Microbacterium ginsengisoli]